MTTIEKISPRTYGPLLTIERTFKAPVAKVWALWTTVEGLEKWYWPEPLVAKVLHLDLRVGGRDEISAVGTPYMSRGIYTEIVPNVRLRSTLLIDFIEGVQAYDREDDIVFSELPDGTTKMVFTTTHMHSDHWQNMSQAGWSSSLQRLDRVIAE